MEFHNAHLIQGPGTDSSRCCVDADAELLEVFKKTAEGCHPYLFVQDEHGDPVGVLAAEDVLQRVTNPNPSEMGRWMNMPVEAALQSRLQKPDTAAGDEDTDCTKVSRDGVLLGVLTENDVLISWRSIQKTLKTSQDDAVTTLPTRAAFDQHLAGECNRAERSRHSVAVVLIDLDHFKQINDRFGHAAGDAALKTVATVVRAKLRSYDLVARFGGDEFAVICSGCRPGEIEIVVRRIRECVLQLQEDATVPRPVPTISVGACVAHDMYAIADPSEIVRVADEALYAAKEAGRNCAFKSELNTRMSPQPALVRDRFTNRSALESPAVAATH